MRSYIAKLQRLKCQGNVVQDQSGLITGKIRIDFQKPPGKILVQQSLLRARMYLVSLTPGFWRA
jgi:hypothetical protein